MKQNALLWSDSEIVVSKQGELQGKRLHLAEQDKTCDVFLGVPYAKPPIGSMRFKKPEDLSPWSGVREAREWARVSIQREVFWKFRKVNHSEDCLYLNVFAPTWRAPEESSNGFPVMLFIHGGGFTVGDALTYGDVGICERLVAKDVIVVTIQYRLGFLGFWHIEDSDIPANLGLWDQTAALKWVQENIGAFGGDKNNVTVVGQSAGGVSADLLRLSPHSNRLFHKAIVMSGNSYCSWALTTAEKMSEKCKKKAREMGIKWTSPLELQNKLMKADASQFETPLSMCHMLDEGLPVAPIIDGDFLPESLEILRKRAPSMPIMTGVTELEAMLFEMTSFSTEQRVRAANKLIHPDDTQSDLAETYLEQARTKQKGRLEFISDVFFNAPTLCLAQEQKAYLYVFKYCNMMKWGIMRHFMQNHEATHGTELAYLFGKNIVSPYALTDDDVCMCEIFTHAITNFMKFSDPNSQDATSFTWPAVTAETPEVHTVFTLNPVVSSDFFNGSSARLLSINDLGAPQ